VVTACRCFVSYRWFSLVHYFANFGLLGYGRLAC
jgi:hypothetical protein